MNIEFNKKKVKEYPPVKRGCLIYLLVLLIIIVWGPILNSPKTTSDAPSESPTVQRITYTTTPLPSLISMNVQYDNAILVYNDHVGNEWATAVQINGNYPYQRESIDIAVYDNEYVTIFCYVNENDKIMDYGSANILIDPTKLKSGRNFFTCNVIVTENRGRYSGNTAKWEFSFTVTKN